MSTPSAARVLGLSLGDLVTVRPDALPDYRRPDEPREPRLIPEHFGVLRIATIGAVWVTCVSTETGERDLWLPSELQRVAMPELPEWLR